MQQTTDILHKPHATRVSIKYLLYGLLAIIMQSTLAAGTFRWMDSAGNVFYGDVPPEDAINVEALAGDDCDSEECLLEREQLSLEAEERHQEIQESLDKIDQQRAEELKQQAEIEKARQMAAPVVNPTIIVAPDAWDGRYIDQHDWRTRRRYRPQHYVHPGKRNR